MPPWHADPAYGAWENDRRLTDAERDTLLRWIKQGAPRGRRGPRPPLRPSVNEGEGAWRLGAARPRGEVREGRASRQRPRPVPGPGAELSAARGPVGARGRDRPRRPARRASRHHLRARGRAGRAQRLAGRLGGRHGADGLPRRHRPPAQEGQPADRQHALPPDRRGGAGRDHARPLLPRRPAREGAGQPLGAELVVQDPRRRRRPRGALVLHLPPGQRGARAAAAHALPRQGLHLHRGLSRRAARGAAQGAGLRLQLADASTSSPSRSSCPRARASSASPTTTTRRRTGPTPIPPRTSPSATSRSTR